MICWNVFVLAVIKIIKIKASQIDSLLYQYITITYYKQWHILNYNQ